MDFRFVPLQELPSSKHVRFDDRCSVDSQEVKYMQLLDSMYLFWISVSRMEMLEYIAVISANTIFHRNTIILLTIIHSLSTISIKTLGTGYGR